MQNTLASLGVSIAAVAALAAPMQAFAYLSPDQVFGGQSTTFDRTDASSHQAPPTARDGDGVQATQQQRSAELRSSAQSQLTPNYAEPQDTYVAPEPAAQPSLLNDEVNYQKRMERIEEGKGNGPTIIIGGQGTVVDSNGNILHSGAPIITQTGPESILAVIAMVLAAACTLVYSSVRSRAQIAVS